MKNINIRNIIISVVVIVWLIVFNYESLRYFYLNPLFRRDLPKVKLLFPPAGWIMFFNVGEGFGYVKVYGVKQGRSYEIDPHQILLTRNIGYDNIHRNVLSSVLSPQVMPQFCNYLKKKFSYYESFVVTYVNYPSVVRSPLEYQEGVAYECR